MHETKTKQHEPPTASPIAPPTSPGEIRRSTSNPLWPSFIGVVTAVHAGACVIINSILGYFLWITPQPDDGRTIQLTSAAVLLVLAALLLLAGIDLARRKRWATVGLPLLAAARILLLGLSVAADIWWETGMWGNPSDGFFGLALVAIWGIAWYAFLLFWFVRPGVRAQARSWR